MDAIAPPHQKLRSKRATEDHTLTFTLLQLDIESGRYNQIRIAARAPYEFGDIQINARGKINVEEQEFIYDD